jgi:hypothetical protein
MSAVQFFLDLEQLKEYVTRFYNNGMDDLEIPEGRNLSDYDHFIVQFKLVKNNIIIEEVWGVNSQEEGAYGERIGYFEYENPEWIEDGLIWLKEKVAYSIYGDGDR